MLCELALSRLCVLRNLVLKPDVDICWIFSGSHDSSVTMVHKQYFENTWKFKTSYLIKGFIPDGLGKATWHCSFGCC